MALVRYSVFYNGPYALYTSRTGLTDIRTQMPELGGGLNLGDFCDLTEAEANSWSQQYGGQANQLHAGRYRFAQVQAKSTAASCVYGAPCGIGLGTTVQQAVIANAGSGYTAGTYAVNSSTSGGTTAATAVIVVGSSGTIISATITNPGAGFTSVPTFSLTALGSGSSGSVIAQLSISENTVGSFDTTASVSLYSPRGLFLFTTALTTAQVTAGAYGLIQEQGIGTVLVTTATNTAVPCSVSALTGGAITTATAAANTIPAGFMGYTLDVAAAAAYCRVQLQLPQWAG